MIHFRQYLYTDNLFTGDYLLVRELLLKLNKPTYPLGWWDHQVTRPSFSAEYLSKFGLWFDDEQLVAIACVEESLGNGILCVLDSHSQLINDMLDYAKGHLHDQGRLSLMIPDLDKGYQEAAARAGFIPTQERDTESIMQLDLKKLCYSLPNGFQIINMADNYNGVQFERVMRRGFSGSREERTLSASDILTIDRQFIRPFVNLDLQIAAVAPDKTFAAFCGLWYTKGSPTVFIEPVVTDPDYQRMGLGKAVLYEALKRCVKLGAESAVVLSSIQFYFNIGFRPNSTSTWWKMNKSQQ